jgi:uncharacterized ferritin-like protein (DUF455 family)
MSIPSSPSQTAFPELRTAALNCLAECDVAAKVDAVGVLIQAWNAYNVALDADQQISADFVVIPGRPARPELVPPLEVGRRSMRTVEGRAALIHALAHIEFNAINLALDAIWRFPCMPVEYYGDWLRVAAEEAYHFSLLAQHLQRLGYAYGSFNAHNSLWDMAEKTKHDVLARIALVPRTLEARGLDASPPLRAKLAQVGDTEAVEILTIILRDEIGHVAIGNRWYGWLCKQRQLDPVATYAELALRYKAPQLRGPFNLEARRAAGFSEDELAALGE